MYGHDSHQAQSGHSHRDVYIGPQDQVSIFGRDRGGGIEEEFVQLISHVFFPSRCGSESVSSSPLALRLVISSTDQLTHSFGHLEIGTPEATQLESRSGGIERSGPSLVQPKLTRGRLADCGGCPAHVSAYRRGRCFISCLTTVKRQMPHTGMSGSEQ